MTRSDRDPDACQRIRDNASVLGRTCGYCGFTGDMMAYAQHVCPRDVMQSEIDSLNAKDSEKTRDINLLTQENRQQTAQLATVRSELAMVEAQRDELQRALKAKTDWVEKVGERAAKLASRIASNDYEVQAMESLANELAAATERERGYVALLGDVEWVLDKEYLYRYCPECEKAQSDGHAAGCRIAAALAAAQPAISGEDEAYALDDLKSEYRSLTR